MQANNTFVIEIDSDHADRDAQELVERIASSDADVRRHLSDESMFGLRNVTTSKIELNLTAAAVPSVAHALLSWLKAKPSNTHVTVQMDSVIYHMQPGEYGDTDRFIEFLRSAVASNASYSGALSIPPPGPWPL